MGKAELTAPWGGRWVEGGEGEAGGSCLERRAEEIYRGRGEVVSAQGEWERVRPASWLSLGDLSAGPQPPPCCSVCVPAAPSKRPWGPRECVCMLVMGGGCHRPAGTASERGILSPS